MTKIEFTKEFATMKKGDIGEYDSQLASKLVRDLKVAKFPKPQAKKVVVKKDS